MKRDNALEGAFGRREFLAGCVAAASTGCVAVGDDAGPVVVDPNLVALVSDIHVAQPYSEQKYRTGREYPHVNGKIREFVSEILALRPLPANVIALGDISLAFAEEREYGMCREFLKPLEDAGVKITHALGNHDRMAEFLTAYPEYRGRGGIDGKAISEVSTPHADFILLDSHVECETAKRGTYPGCEGKGLGGRQIDWLKGRLESAARPTFLCAHHTASDLGVAKIAAKAPMVYGWLHGHHHHWMTNYLSNGYGTNAKTILQFGLPSFGLDRDVGYALMRISGNGAKVTCLAKDYYFPVPPDVRLKEGGPGNRPAAWEGFRRNWDGRRIYFAFDK